MNSSWIVRLKWPVILLVMIIGLSFLPGWWRARKLTPSQREVLGQIRSDEYQAHLLVIAEEYAQANGPHLTRGELKGIVKSVRNDVESEFWERLK